MFIFERAYSASRFATRCASPGTGGLFDSSLTPAGGGTRLGAAMYVKLGLLATLEVAEAVARVVRDDDEGTTPGFVVVAVSRVPMEDEEGGVGAGADCASSLRLSSSYLCRA